MASLFSMSTKLCNQHLFPGLIEVKIIEVKKKSASICRNEPRTDQFVGAAFVCMVTETAEVSLLPQWRMQQTTTPGIVTSVTHTVSWMWPHHTHTHRRTHTQNTCLGCHEARNVFLFLYILVKFLAQDEEKDKIYSGLVFSEAVNCVFLTGTLSFCTHLSVQPFTLGDSHALRLKMTLFWKLTMKT